MRRTSLSRGGRDRAPRFLAGAAVAVAALAVAPAQGAGALGLPEAFPLTITRTGTAQHVRVTRFEVTTRAAGTTKLRVDVRVAAVSLKGKQPLLIAVAPCTGGTPSCRPTATARLQLGATQVRATRSLLVARPAKGHDGLRDALRVTLSAGGARVPFVPLKIGGGGGTAELLLNGGAWRFRQGTPWGLVSASPSRAVLDHVWFNSLRLEWGATAPTRAAATTTIGYAGEPPSSSVQSTLRAGAPFLFFRTRSQPIQALRTAPREFLYSARISDASLFTVRLPLPVWDPRSGY